MLAHGNRKILAALRAGSRSFNQQRNFPFKSLVLACNAAFKSKVVGNKQYLGATGLYGAKFTINLTASSNHDNYC